MSPIDEAPYRYEQGDSAQAVAADPRFSDLAPGAGSGIEAGVAGRVMRLRSQGKVTFAELRDWTGAIQLFADESRTPEYRRFEALSLGDWVGARGEVVRTRRGELSVRVESWSLLARARRDFGDKWRGVRDIETRHRQREVDLWANEGVRETFLLRSQVLSALRRELEGRGFVEVETPILHPIASGAHARPFATHYNALHADFYLRIAIELYLKRLIVGGFERVFEIGRVFRNEGLSPRHNPEFTMLELYQAYADFRDMMELVEGTVAEVARQTKGATVFSYQGRSLDLSPPWRRATMEELVREQTGVEVTLAVGRDELARRAADLGVEVGEHDGPGKILQDVYEHTTEHTLFQPVFVTDYPKEVSPLARDHRTRPGYVERFEAVVAGRELVNAFSELADPDEQRARFLIQAEERAAGDEEAMALDEEFLRALEHGMPPTGGIVIGIDRLVMLLADKANIREVILFPALRPLGRNEARADEGEEPEAPVAEPGEGAEEEAAG